MFVLAAVVVLAAGLYFGQHSGSDFRIYSNDFNVYYFAAREILSGRDPYQYRLGLWTPYLYPPVLAELITPLALLPLPVAAFIWFVISAISIALAAHLASILSREVLAEHGQVRTEPVSTTPGRETVVGLVALIVVGRFVLDCFAMGQVNTIVTCLAVAHVYLYWKGRPRLSALALALAAGIKLTPAILIIYHLAKGRIRFAIASSLMLACVLGASFLVFGRGAISAVAAFRRQTIANGQGFDLGYSGNQSIRTAESRALSQPDEARTKPFDSASLAVSCILLLGGIVAARRRTVEVAAAAPIFCCMIMLSPLAWKAHFIALLLPAAFLAARALTPARGLSCRVATLALPATLGLFTLTSRFLIGLPAAEWADRHSLILLGALITYLAVLVF